jgi:periplasmic divalent cation tolerance protein
MERDTDFVVVLSTAPSEEVGRKIARDIVRARLAACVNVVPGVVSIFEWKGKLEEENEVLLVMKTTRDRAGEVVRKVVELHPYEVPEVIALPIVEGNPEYLSWVLSSADSERIPEDSSK